MFDDPLSQQAQIDRKMCQRSLYYLCKEVLGYRDMVPHVHGELCHFATHTSYGRFRQQTVPRSWFKTWVLTVGKSIWLTLPDEEGIYKDLYPSKGANMRILIASNVIDNAAKMINKIKAEWMNNTRLKAAFPELIPDYNKTRWSDHCAQVKRTIKAQEGTYTAVGAGGSVISQHFDHIIEDDLIYAKKDDFTGQELMPSQEDIDNAIGWHRISFSLLSNPKTGTMDNVGTRWAPHDLIAYIRKFEPHYRNLEVAVTVDGAWPIPDNSFCIWPERYDIKTLEQIRASQGPRIFETQYLNRPRAGEDVVFKTVYLNRHDSLFDYPAAQRLFTIVDLASWGDSKRLCRNVVLTGCKDKFNHLWIHRVDAGRYNPSEVIALMKAHSQQFGSKVLVEEIQYQKALRHFANIDMQKEGSYVYTIEAIPYDGRANAKDLRIQSLQPFVENGMVHILKGMTDLVQEMDDYPYGATKDILDCLGYLNRHASAGYSPQPKQLYAPNSLDAILEELKAGSAQSFEYPFDVQLGKGAFR